MSGDGRDPHHRVLQCQQCDWHGCWFWTPRGQYLASESRLISSCRVVDLLPVPFGPRAAHGEGRSGRSRNAFDHHDRPPWTLSFCPISTPISTLPLSKTLLVVTERLQRTRPGTPQDLLMRGSPPRILPTLWDDSSGGT